MTGFYKTARVVSVATASFDEGDGLLKVASHQRQAQETRSYYLDGSRKLSVKEALKKAAANYDISADPKDYLFEAIRANTTNVPNENHDAFAKSELLRYDKVARGPVYMTYVGKPHHINHQTENPKTARGVILDAHYNEDAAALKNCPGCGTETLDKRARDESGIHCIKCGAVAKDEFVEILVAVDTKKDPLFAEGVRTGALKAGSMGCNCARTQCNVCANIAYSRPEFCEHIRQGNKGTLWHEQSDGSWKRLERRAAEQLLRKASIKLSPDFCYASGGDDKGRRASRPLRVRKAYELCQDVEFDEYSRVDQPADPKALQREILKAASAQGTPSVEDLKNETELLMLRQRLASLESHVATHGKGNIQEHATTLDIGNADVEVGNPQDPDDPLLVVYPGLAEAGGPLPLPGMEEEFVEEQVDIEDPDKLTLLDLDEAELDQGADPRTGEPANLMDFGVQPPPGTPPRTPGRGAAKRYPKTSTNAPRKSSREGGRMFRQAYKDWTVDVTERGNVRVMSPKGAVALVRARKKPKNNEERASFGREVLAHLFDKGLVKTVKKYKALRAPKLAQFLDDALSGMKDHQSKPPEGEVSKGGLTGMADGAIYGGVYSNNTKIEDDGSTDHEHIPGDGADEIQLGGDADHKTNIPADSNELEITENPDGGMGPDARKPFNLSKDFADNGGAVDHVNVPFKPSASKRTAFKVVARSWLENNREAKRSNMETWLATPDGNGAYALIREGENARRATIAELRKAWMALDAIPEAASQRVAGRVDAEKSVDRTKKLYEQRFEALKKEASEAIAQAQAKTIDHFCRAIRVASHRQDIGLEDCGLKEAFATALANDRVVGEDSDGCELVYTAMTPELAVHLTESAWAEGSEDHLNNLLSRAAELASRSPEYLRDAEADLKKHSHRIASVNQSTLVSETRQNKRAVAEEVREAALGGNFALNTAPPVSKKPTNGHNKSASIRSALSATRTNAYTRQIRS